MNSYEMKSTLHSKPNVAMTEVTQILSAIEAGDPAAANQLLPLVYGELRRLAAAKLAPGDLARHGRPRLWSTKLTCDLSIRQGPAVG